MSFSSNIELQIDDVASARRSSASWEFERFWRSLPRDGLVPGRSAFRPERARTFLRDLVLCEISLEPELTMNIRLTGTAFDARTQQAIKGQNYVQYISPQYRSGLVKSVCEIIERPCGLWQIMSVHYQRGFAQNIEITVFPLMPATGGQHELLILARDIDGLVEARSTNGLAMAADTASTYQFIDVGAGVPIP